jgi:uncharacterized membrane protein
MAEAAAANEASSGPEGVSRRTDGGESPSDMINVCLQPGRENVTLVYVLYLAGLVPAFGAVPIMVGFVMVLLNRRASDGIWSGHYEFLLRQAAIGLAGVVVSGIFLTGFLVFVLIGVIGLVIIAGWWILRSVRGLQAAAREEPIHDPRSFGW